MVSISNRGFESSVFDLCITWSGSVQSCCQLRTAQFGLHNSGRIEFRPVRAISQRVNGQLLTSFVWAMTTGDRRKLAIKDLSARSQSFCPLQNRWHALRLIASWQLVLLEPGGRRKRTPMRKRKRNVNKAIPFFQADGTAQRPMKRRTMKHQTACLIRFRPIMMTTFAALMAALPIAVGIGAGARRPLGMAVVGGLLFSQLVTLYLTPVFFTYLEGLHERVARVQLALRRRFDPKRDAGELRPQEANA
jgi:hypothetical protein